MNKGIRSWSIVIGMLLGALIGFDIGFFCGANLNARKFQWESVNHNAAHYDTQTGVWTWNQ